MAAPGRPVDTEFVSAKTTGDLRPALVNRITNLPEHTVSVVGSNSILVARSFIPNSAYVWAGVGTLFFFLVAPLFLWLLVARRTEETLTIEFESDGVGTAVKLRGIGSDAFLAAVRETI